MRKAERYAFTAASGVHGVASLLPLLPLLLRSHERSITVSGLLDTGATVNVLPYSLGMELGAVWEDQATPVQLTGNLGQYEARALLLVGEVGRFAPVRLVFAWTRTDAVRLILGQVNFFLEFDACFYRSRQAFEIKPRP